MHASLFIPASLWLLCAALVVTVLLCFFFMHFFWRKRQRAFLRDGEDVVELAARKVQTEADVKALQDWIAQQKDELLRLTGEREEQERIRNELTDLEQRCLAKDQENEALRQEVGELENRKHMAAQTLEQLQKHIGDIESNRSQAEALKRDIKEMENRLEESRGILAKVPEAEIRLNVLNREKTSLEARIQGLKQDAATGNATLAKIKEELQSAEGELDTLNESRKERAQLNVLVDSLRSEQNALERDVSRLETSIESLGEKSQKLTEMVDDGTSACEDLGRQLAVKREELDRTQEAIQKLEIRKDRLESEVEGLAGADTGADSEGDDRRYADLLVRKANCLHQNEFDEPSRETDEYTALRAFKEDLQRRKLYFPSRVIDAFHTSLKCQKINPLTVLAGVSGTGKTLLPMKYAEFMGLHSLVIPVQPRWDSPQDLFGFYNYLEKEYKATELSRALVRMDPYNYRDGKTDDGYIWPRKRLLMVLLDEMNLARTEYYFSEFLSKLELRRQVDNSNEPAQRDKAEVELDTGPGRQQSLRIWVPENVLFVGTMNEDETTQTLSDKVLDRSNVLRFGKPDERQQSGNEGQQSNQHHPFLTYKQWTDWQRESRPNDSWYDEATGWIRSINNGLERVGRPFGFRVEDAILLYLANYPGVDHEDRYKLAFADQIEQKIIPKLRGLEMDDLTIGCLGTVESVIAGLGDEALSRTFNTAKDESKNLGMFTWRGVTRTLDDKE
ncbi:AAA family ATPase [Desulfovibrio sp. Huiquan2017]|uniref:AAA family ATPase n=1 Tax=Desulfovibrio sp. Huiquan2017 TaxID=2816861 RepID=UPI001A932229|nr:AAA family ATPase [Desulfovibrio sp. Huiquan2017]